MNSSESIKETVREKYTLIVQQTSSCCGPAASNLDCCTVAEDYTKLKGYTPEADLGLGCGVPTQIARIRPGDTVVDLGSGAGNDAFVVRSIVGETGLVIGIDFTEEMIRKAQRNTEKLGFQNVRFVPGDIENIPLDAETADVVISNCVLNLVPDKRRAFAEIHRILKAGGHFSISDIVTDGELPVALRSAAEMYVGCVAGALKKEEYLGVIRDAGFRNISLAKERAIFLPDEVLSRYLKEKELAEFRNSGARILSITVFAEK